MTSNPRFYFDGIVILVLLFFTWFKRRELSKPIGTKGSLVIIGISLLLLLGSSFYFSTNGLLSISSDVLFYRTNAGMGHRYMRSFGYLLLAYGSFVFTLNFLGLTKKVENN